MVRLKSIGAYKILEEIGRSDLAMVYKAQEKASDRVVALKVIRPHLTADTGFIQTFLEEMEAVVGLDHAHIAPVHEVGEVKGRVYVATEYLPGRTLRALLDAEKPLPLDRAQALLKQIAEALDRAHAYGVIHYDVRPGNVMVEDGSEGVQATVVDFGLIRVLEKSPEIAAQGALLGVPEYMAPESADPARADEAGSAVDRYALGVVAYEMLVGRVPFPGNTPKTLAAHATEPPPPPRSLRPELPEVVEEALLKMLSKEPIDRYPSARAFTVRMQEAPPTKSRIWRRQARLAPFYERMQKADQRQDWETVLSLGRKIQALDPHYRDVSQIISRAEERHRRQQRRRGLRWVWRLGLLAVVAVVGWGAVWGINELRQGMGEAAPAPPVVASPTVPTPTPVSQAATSPTVEPTPTALPTATPTPLPTATLTPEPTATPETRPVIDTRFVPRITWDADPISVPYVDGRDYRFWFTLSQRSGSEVEVEILRYRLVHLASGQQETGNWPRTRSQWYTLPSGEPVRDGFNVRTVHSPFLEPVEGEMRAPGRYQLILRIGSIRVGDRTEYVGMELDALSINAYEP